MNNNPTRIMKEVPPEWDNLMYIAERLEFGELRIVVKNGKPVRIESGIKQINLDVPSQDMKEQLKITPLL